MAGNVFVGSDWHLFHKKAAAWRGFKSVEEHNDWVVSTAIESIGSRDSLILGGDVNFGTAQQFDALLKRHMGTKFHHTLRQIGHPTEDPKYLELKLTFVMPFTIKNTMGNHDRNRITESKCIASHHGSLEYGFKTHARTLRKMNDPFDKLYVGGEASTNANCVFTHIPVHPECMTRWTYNIHGHTHSGIIDNPLYINSCVETIREINESSVIRVDELINLHEAKWGIDWDTRQRK